MSDSIRAALERLVELDGLPDSWSPAGIQAWDDAIAAGKAALAEPESNGPAVPKSREPASVAGESIDDAELDELFTEIDQSGEALSWRAYARAALARWGQPSAPPVPPLKERPDFIAGYREGLADGRRIAEDEETEQQGEGPSESDVAELFYRYMGAGPEAGFENAIAEALSRWGHQPARLRNCPTHGQQPPEAWGCPECVRELREELHRTVPVQPTPPAEGEVAELVEWLHDCADVRMDEGYEEPAFKFARAAELLQRQHPTPVPVSERLPAMVTDGLRVAGDCDEQGRCWAGTRAFVDTSGDRDIDYPPSWELREVRAQDDVWLPAHALPLPQGEVE